MGEPVLLAMGAATVSAAVTRAEGSAVPAYLQLCSEFGTCELLVATVVVITEEGTGRCFVYPYKTRELADSYFNRMSWRPFSRMMFNCLNGVVEGIEVQSGGLHSMPFKTIRRCALRLSIFEKVFVQSDAFGMASFHFITDSEAFICYESDKCSLWRCDDDRSLPHRKPFEHVSYDPTTRTFRAVVSWAPTSFCGDERWEYEMTFDRSFSSIVGGQVYHFTPGLTDRTSPEQVHRFAAEASITVPSILRYRRWCPPKLMDATAHEGFQDASSLGEPGEPNVCVVPDQLGVG